MSAFSPVKPGFLHLYDIVITSHIPLSYRSVTNVLRVVDKREASVDYVFSIVNHTLINMASLGANYLCQKRHSIPAQLVKIQKSFIAQFFTCKWDKSLFPIMLKILIGRGTKLTLKIKGLWRRKLKLLCLRRASCSGFNRIERSAGEKERRKTTFRICNSKLHVILLLPLRA
ncbi:MAG: hypothetical protein AAFR71_01620 [Pseudomonadota bacterium]